VIGKDIGEDKAADTDKKETMNGEDRKYEKNDI
jgi:hypothetical protein